MKNPIITRVKNILKRRGFDIDNKELFLSQLTEYTLKNERGFGECESNWGPACSDVAIELFGDCIVRIGRGITTTNAIKDLNNLIENQVKEKMELSEKAIASRRKYYRDYYRKNAEKRRQWANNHWEKVAQNNAENENNGSVNISNDNKFKNAYTNVKPFQSIKDAATTTGLSEWYLRNGIKNGSVPYVCTGKKYLVNVPLLLKQLNAI